MYKMCYKIYLLFVTVCYTIMGAPEAARFDCYVCSYTRSSDPTINYDCINQGNKSNTLACQTPYLCKTVALFNQDMSHIRSVDRNCLPQVDNCQGERCCNMAGTYPLCEQKCRGSKCNSFNPESWLRGTSNGESGNKDDGSNIGSSMRQSAGNHCVIAMVILVLSRSCRP